MEIFFMVFTMFIAGAFVYYLFINRNSPIVNLNLAEVLENSKYNDNDLALRNKFGNQINDIIQGFNCVVTLAECLTVIRIESVYRGLTEDNSSIIGDVKYKNKAYGIFQVRLPALKDVNSKYNLSYKESDLKLLHVNIIAGVLYLNLCKEQAQRETPLKDDQTYLMFKKYNGGIGISKEKINSAHSYSLSALDKYSIFENIA